MTKTYKDKTEMQKVADLRAMIIHSVRDHQDEPKVIDKLTKYRLYLENKEAISFDIVNGTFKDKTHDILKYLCDLDGHTWFSFEIEEQFEESL